MKQIRKILWIMSVVTLLLAMPTTVSAVTKEKFVGTTYRINVKGNFKWTSSNKKIAVVNQRNKTVKALKAGTVIITGKNGTLEKKFKLRVKNPYINANNLTIYAGKTGQLRLRGTSAVKWKTSNSKIVSVSSKGLIRGKKKGKAVITVTGKNGKKYICKVKVIQNSASNAAKNGHIYKVAHRGNTTIAPENTLSAFKTAVGKGYRYIETDVQFTRDNVPVIIHDPYINNTSNGTGYVSSLTFDQIRSFDFGSWKNPKYAGEKIPSFQEFLDFCKDYNVHPYIELKEDPRMTRANIQKLYDMVCAAGLQNNVTWFSFEYNYISVLKQVAPSADIGYVAHIYSTVSNNMINQLKKLKTATNSVFLCCFPAKISSSMLTRCKKENIQLVARDIQSMDDINKLDPYYRCAITNGF